MKGDYEEISCFEGGEKTKPNKAKLFSFRVQRSEFSGKIRKGYLKKQSQC